MTIQQLAAYTEWLTNRSEDCDSPTDESGRFLCPAIGQEVVPRGDLQAWETLPPITPLLSRGETTTIRANDRYVVRDVWSVSPVPTGTTYYYLRVDSLDSQDTSCRTKACWVYQGADGSENAPNLIPRIEG